MSRNLSSDLGKRKPFETTHQEIVISILRTNELFQHRFARLFREHGLTQAQYNALRILAGAKAPIPSLEVAARMIKVAPAITRILDTLEERGLVDRDRSPDDRRVWLIRISTVGKKLLREMAKPNLEMHKALVGHLTDREADQFLKLLEKARAPHPAPNRTSSSLA